MKRSKMGVPDAPGTTTGGCASGKGLDRSRRVAGSRGATPRDAAAAGDRSAAPRAGPEGRASGDSVAVRAAEGAQGAHGKVRAQRPDRGRRAPPDVISSGCAAAAGLRGRIRDGTRMGTRRLTRLIGRSHPRPARTGAVAAGRHAARGGCQGSQVPAAAHACRRDGRCARDRARRAAQSGGGGRGAAARGGRRAVRGAGRAGR